MEIRPAQAEDIGGVTTIYAHILDAQETGDTPVGWVRGVYPTAATAREAWAQGELFVGVQEGTIVAAAILNQRQMPAYEEADWTAAVPPEQVLVLHTLVVEPACKGQGWGSRFVAYYEALAREKGCRALRLDTNARNLPARRLYDRLGFREAGIIPCVFNGIPGVSLVCLEKML